MLSPPRARPRGASPLERAGQASYSLTTLASLETALAGGLEEQWRSVVDDDPLASVYQTSGWCMPWYRCYRDAFDPYVIVVSAGGRTVGLVPMAVDRDARTGVRQQRHGRLPRHRALPGYREAVSGN